MACDGKTRFHEVLTKESRDPVGKMWEDVTQSNRFQGVLGAVSSQSIRLLKDLPWVRVEQKTIGC